MLWNKVDVQPSGCWVWTGANNGKGYGQIRINNKTTYAHRVSYRHFKGDIPDGFLVMHRCDNRACVNPAHLTIGTAEDNSADMIAKGRQASGEKSNKTKLTEADVIKIRSDTRRQHKIAKEYGIGQSAVSRIKNGKRWNHELVG